MSFPAIELTPELVLRGLVAVATASLDQISDIRDGRRVYRPLAEWPGVIWLAIESVKIVHFDGEATETAIEATLQDQKWARAILRRLLSEDDPMQTIQGWLSDPQAAGWLREAFGVQPQGGRATFQPTKAKGRGRVTVGLVSAWVRQVATEPLTGPDLWETLPAAGPRGPSTVLKLDQDGTPTWWPSRYPGREGQLTVRQRHLWFAKVLTEQLKAFRWLLLAGDTRMRRHLIAHCLVHLAAGLDSARPPFRD
jgi:hypothetical protein